MYQLNIVWFIQTNIKHYFLLPVNDVSFQFVTMLDTYKRITIMKKQSQSKNYSKGIDYFLFALSPLPRSVHIDQNSVFYFHIRTNFSLWNRRFPIAALV